MKPIRKFIGVLILVLFSVSFAIFLISTLYLQLYIMVSSLLITITSLVFLIIFLKNNRIEKQNIETIPSRQECCIISSAYTSSEEAYQFNSSVYVIDANGIYRTDGKPIPDEDIPYIKQMSYEKAVMMENDYKSGKRNIFMDQNITPNEDIFFKAFIKALKENNLNPDLLKLRRLSGGTFNVDYVGLCYIGKINLTKPNAYMQYLRGANTIKHLNDLSLQECIDLIPYWIRYIKYCKRN